MREQESRIPAPWSFAVRPRHESAINSWTSLARIGFRFSFGYLVLYCLYLIQDIQVLVEYSFTKPLLPEGFLSPLWHVAVPWVGHHILHLRTAITVFTNGSGDTTYDYVLVLCELAIAAIATFFWSILDRKRPNYRVLHHWLRLMVRIALASQMINYGMAKLIPVQFGDLPLSTLIRPFGEMSPNTLLWNFMAASPSYTVFAGLIEVLAGILLLIPRTVALGAVVSLAATSNVLALDLSYDVAVKLLSFQLALLSAFLLIPELRRLTDVFVFNRTAEPVVYVPYSKRSWINRATVLLPLVWGILLLSLFLFDNYKIWSVQQATAADRSPFYGVWQVDRFTNTSSVSGPLFTAKLQQEMEIAAGEDRWQRVLFESSKIAVLQLEGGVIDQVDSKLDLNKGSLVLTDSGDPVWRCTFQLKKLSASILALEGDINGIPVSVTLHRLADSKYPLTSWGFHLISDHTLFN